MALSDGHHAVRGQPPALAVDFLHFTASVMAGVGLNDGVPKSAAMRALLEQGQPAESECPYSPTPRLEGWKPATSPNGDMWRYRTAVASVAPWAAIEFHVGGGKPVVLVLNIDDAFWHPVAGVVAKPSGLVRGSHALLALDVDAQRPSVLVRNSWGDEWGDGGYAWLSPIYVAAQCTAVITFEDIVL
jgi:hypothetical protein